MRARIHASGPAGPLVIFLGILTASSSGILAAPTVMIEEIGPDRSTLDPNDPDGASGGRVNGLATVAGDNSTFYAASEWGGLFKSTDSARTWQHLPGHVPVATWDVEVDPENANRVYATSRYDGRVGSRAGINVSTDAGATWQRPVSTVPPADFCQSEVRREEPAAYGIAVDPDSPADVYVGTNCGLAISNDRGVSWRFVDPTPDDPADNIWDVLVHDDGIIDLCGDLGHARSTDGGATWAQATSDPLPSGVCSLTVSPEESYVLFAVTGTMLFESDDGGQSWPVAYVNPSPQGRIPFFAVNDRAGNGFDLWFGDTSLHRASCTTPDPPSPGGAQRCPPSTGWAGEFTRDFGGHDDVGDIAFDSEGGDEDACPVVFSSDGGVYFNLRTTSPECHTPEWEQPDDTPQALWNWSMAAARRPGAAEEDLYFGNQDNGSFGSRNAGDVDPSWINERCCDIFDVAAEPTRVLSTVCCFVTSPPLTRIRISSPGLTFGSFLSPANAPPGSLLRFQQLPSIANIGTGAYVVVTTTGIYVTADISAPDVDWVELGDASSPAGACGVEVSSDGASPVFYVKSGGCDGDRGGGLFRYEGVAPNGVWQQVLRSGASLFGVYDVDPNDADRIIASDLTNFMAPEMVMTADGGASWQALAGLDHLMTAGGLFHYTNRSGPKGSAESPGYPQPTLVAFDPEDEDLIVAGAADAGVFLSTDAGASWSLVTDPHTPHVSAVPHIPRPRYAHFDHDQQGEVKIYLGTKGRGTWRLTLVPDPCSILD